MNELDDPKRDDKKDIQEGIGDPDLDMEREPPLPPPGLRNRIRRLLQNIERGGPGSRKELAKDRTRSLALLLGGTVGAVLLFMAVFSTPARPPS